MAKLTRAERDAIALRRILRILETHGAATPRTLEQKISDAGPNPQRIDPHILTPVRNALAKEGRIRRVKENNVTWYHRAETPPLIVEQRIAEQRPVLRSLLAANHHIGQALEIATYRALLESHPYFHGRFHDIDIQEDSIRYKKEEPPQHLGPRSIPGNQCLDFMVIDPVAGPIGIECKNVREWLYPHRLEIMETAIKCLSLDCIPVLIARRIPYVTFKLLNACGWVIHQNFNQIMPNHLRDVVDVAKDKKILGYHDLRVGNIPDARLLKFIQRDMVPSAIQARARFNKYKDLLERFATKDISYAEFAARLRRRELGQNEDHDWPEPEVPEGWVENFEFQDPTDWFEDP
ncbi:hypothetical protein FV222_10730 [Methylobacterium sp. WL103]|uniref:hypothetical protein n=1 Tax=Methylobacterium sp. WL103 TaxID=2603891 RepID=UPI0011C72B7E|nr:hypothetical protein [Methylobacterium sp. WL103]TXN01385.1 hypothetical protein FV222_10730 [Methylobacterium sp. WL103]